MENNVDYNRLFKSFAKNMNYIIYNDEKYIVGYNDDIFVAFNATINPHIE